MTARTAALVLQARNVSLADVFEARSMLEPLAAKAVASSRKRKSAAVEEHWRSHMTVVSRVMLGQDAETVIDLLHHQD
jgi:hypothetical protein